MSSLKNTMEKIKSLEAEKQQLLIERDSLKKIVDEKASKLEREVGALRDEVKSLRGLIGEREGQPEAQAKEVNSTVKV
jgi:hypothetical protein